MKLEIIIIKKTTTTRHTKNWKAAGVDNIAELLKADIDTAVNKIHKTINKVRREGSILQDWTNGGQFTFQKEEIQRNVVTGEE